MKVTIRDAVDPGTEMTIGRPHGMNFGLEITIRTNDDVSNTITVEQAGIEMLERAISLFS